MGPPARSCGASRSWRGGSLRFRMGVRARVRLRAHPPHTRARRCTPRHGDLHGRREQRASCAPAARSSKVAGTNAVSEVTLQRGERAAFVLSGGRHDQTWDKEAVERSFQETVTFWRNWDRAEPLPRTLARDGRPLAHHPQAAHLPSHGAAAVPTTSLPEHIGGPRNWDYRFCWLRDSAFTMFAFLRLGLPRGGAQPTWSGCTGAATWPRRRPAAASDVRHRRPQRPDRSTLSPISRGTAARSRCASARSLPTSCSWTSTARSSTRSTSPERGGMPLTYTMWVKLRSIPRLAGRQRGSAGRGHLGGARRPARLHLLACIMTGWPSTGLSASPDQARSLAGRHATLAALTRDAALRVGDDERAGRRRARPFDQYAGKRRARRDAC